jgi:hypothetical protein
MAGPSPARHSRFSSFRRGPSRLWPLFVSHQNPGSRTSLARIKHGPRTIRRQVGHDSAGLVFPEHAKTTAGGGWRPRPGGPPYDRAALTRCNDSVGCGPPDPHRPADRVVWCTGCTDRDRTSRVEPSVEADRPGRGSILATDRHIVTYGARPGRTRRGGHAGSNTPGRTRRAEHRRQRRHRRTTEVTPGPHTCRVCTIPSMAPPATRQT